ncbi:3-deoxy-manno-octulosonate cytidylyltransferase [Pedobacter metabolipauper]|uniref:3-deoxy-manno-octulosonate cytidylyltransferase n=1 Tax=Pedobacter metabolipauper TaxID=425513 RepID=A0A4R6SYM7_9SPHI|nr:3-deoxy-manno-octulosonate cytidylyltransferase [Pedobacter metabolipauper]TDQ11115.1 3-deoxy-manno-octulosonate cytidylyltransferase (CMP-KDO synthetase) [Pedobacter metabolipauper]
MKILGIIPARYASTRFPGKPLVQINGKSMIRRVYEQACKAESLANVIIATDDERIAAEVKDFGGSYIITASDHLSGTDRCAEVAERTPGYDAFINIQGDEPYIDPTQIDLVASCFNHKDTQLATLIKEIHSNEELFNTNIPKVLINSRQEAIYFSRQTIPHIRNAAEALWLSKHQFYKHIGIYGYTKEALSAITKLPPATLEIAESLEQLRWIENGFSISIRITDIETIAIDTPEDLKKINHAL